MVDFFMTSWQTWEDILESAKTKTPKSSIAKPVRKLLQKQHSILFSVIPSRDQETGEKRVTSDDEMEEVSVVDRRFYIRFSLNFFDVLFSRRGFRLSLLLCENVKNDCGNF